MNDKEIVINAALLLLNKSGQDASAEESLALSKKLKSFRAFNYARRLLERARRNSSLGPRLGLLLDQQCALCTYKDQDLPLAERLDQALNILRESRTDLDNTTDPETLGLGGAVYKRKWEADAQRKNLESALYFYRKGYQQDITKDLGYNGINTALMLDLLAEAESADKTMNAEQQLSASRYRAEALAVRNHIVDILVPLSSADAGLNKDWWYLATVAEAYFGLGDYESARPWLQKAAAMEGISDWEKETTTRQLARLVLLHENEPAGKTERSLAWDVLKDLVGDPGHDAAALQSAFTGKMGLALSGGGFRASLYHIGVLARLAELDVLRKIEVLSCVSGGSIIGAHYYLEVRELLQTKPDGRITASDYTGLVEKISADFLTGIQRNLRMRVLSGWQDDLRMLWNPAYTRTNRLGELYERELFARTTGADEKGPVWLNELFIYPKKDGENADTDFNPKYDNWRRAAKVPILILNATTLNTGHNWQFTASWMGESPSTIQKIDGNYRLRRMYYKNDGDEKSHRKIRLGHAVAASSCVPGMFEPLPLPDLYEGKVIKLVDGGVHDNQGICGLLEQDCTVMLVSDASGQMGTIDSPKGDMLHVPLRANDILMERVRNEQYQDMNSRLRAGLLKGFMYIHLKMGLNIELVDWINCEDPSGEQPGQDAAAPITGYDIRQDIQKKLAAVRTDLDAFNDTEAHALMASGYLMTRYEFGKCIKGFDQQPAGVNWKFLEIADDLVQPAVNPKTLKLLNTASIMAFKVWRLYPALKALRWAGALLAAACLVVTILHRQDPAVLAVESIALTMLYSAVVLLIVKTVLKFLRIREAISTVILGIIPVTIAWLAANLHLSVFDKLYLKKGKR